MNGVDVGELARGVIAAGFENERIDGLPRFGGYLLFARNGESVEEARKLTDALRGGVTTPPLFAIDQEGGRVARLRAGLEPMPPMMALGAAGDVELAERAGEQCAFDLRRAGCTMNLAPVLDLALEPENTVIGTRSLGSDPALVAGLGKHFAQGLERGGVLPCYKHFPGHGSTPTDSHEALPQIDDDAVTLRGRDVVPFAYVARSARAIMGAHLLVRAFDADRPASSSTRIIRGLLREELGFEGAFLTDCLEMGAVTGGAGTLDAAVASLRAGADLLLVSHDSDLAAEIAREIERAVAQGALELPRLSEAYARVTRLREDTAPPLPLHATAPHPGVGREIARRAITLVRGLPHADPTACAVVAFGGSGGDVLGREAPALSRISLDADSCDAGGALERLQREKRRPIVLAKRAHLHPAQAAAIRRIVDAFGDAVVVSTAEPFDVPLFEGARHVLAAYGDDAASLGGLADVLFGGIMPAGRLPVDVFARR